MRGDCGGLLVGECGEEVGEFGEEVGEYGGGKQVGFCIMLVDQYD